MERRRTKIVCTIGPACRDLLEGMIKEGMDMARLNFSHGTHSQHRADIRRIRGLSAELGRPVSIMQDLPGPKLRVGDIAPMELREGDEITLSAKGGESTIPLPYQELVEDIKVGEPIFMDDGKIKLRALGKEEGAIRCEVLEGGGLSSHKGINLPETSLSLPSATEEDLHHLQFGLEEGVDYVALSFVRSAQDVEGAKGEIRKRGFDTPVIAKIEKSEAVKAIDEIVEASDGVMVARGDLGVEVAIEEVALVQKMVIEKCNRAGKPVITATQMLESMVENQRPTRAEVTDVSNAIYDGTDAVMLSGETATGKYPIEAVGMMSKIAIRTEASLDYRQILLSKLDYREETVSDSIAHATCQIAEELRARGIVVSTNSGSTALRVSRFRPSAPILAITPQEETWRRLNLVWGVYPYRVEGIRSTDDMMAKAEKMGLESGLFQRGDKVVITAGIPFGLPGTTNLLKVQTIGG